MTEKLYWQAPEQTSLDDEPARVAEHAGRASVVLARTIFYPEGGGQLGDTGALRVGDVIARVEDTQIDDAGTIHHVVSEAHARAVADAIAAGARVSLTLDAERRRDHAAQHTAQHALSRALADRAGAETVSARLGASICTIDVAKASVPDAELHAVEDFVDALVRANVAVRALYPSPDELASLPLRKQPTVKEGVRLVEIEGFDLTPCGGTHCARTGEIGQARFVSAERYKGGLRLSFHAGRRALVDAREARGLLGAIAGALTCGPADVPAAIEKQRADLKTARHALDAAREELAGLVARELLRALPGGGGPFVVTSQRPTDDVAMTRLLAKALAADARVVALCAGEDPSSGEVVLVAQRGAEGVLDCGAFLLAQAKARSGRGGGRPERAEGRFPRGTSLEVIATAAREAIGAR